MSEMPDPLEQELGGLKPHGVSPELRRRVAERLNARRWTWRHWAAGIATAAAAGLAVLLVWPTPEPIEMPNLGPEWVHVEAATPAAPSMADYRRAFAESPAKFEQLFDQRATVAVNDSGSSGELRANRRFDVNYLAKLGEP